MENTERMQQTDNAWNGRDWDAFDRLHDPDCVVYWPGKDADPTRGGHDHRAEAIVFCDAFPDNKVKNDPYDVLFGDGDMTCFVMVFTRTSVLKQPDGSSVEPTAVLRRAALDRGEVVRRLHHRGVPLLRRRHLPQAYRPCLTDDVGFRRRIVNLGRAAVSRRIVGRTSVASSSMERAVA